MSHDRRRQTDRRHADRREGVLPVGHAIVTPKLTCPHCAAVQVGAAIGHTGQVTTLWLSCERARCQQRLFVVRLPCAGALAHGADVRRALGAASAETVLRTAYAWLRDFEHTVDGRAALWLVPLPGCYIQLTATPYLMHRHRHEPAPVVVRAILAAA